MYFPECSPLQLGQSSDEHDVMERGAEVLKQGFSICFWIRLPSGAGCNNSTIG